MSLASGALFESHWGSLSAAAPDCARLERADGQAKGWKPSDFPFRGWFRWRLRKYWHEMDGSAAELLASRAQFQTAFCAAPEER